MTGVQTCALPIFDSGGSGRAGASSRDKSLAFQLAQAFREQSVGKSGDQRSDLAESPGIAHERVQDDAVPASPKQLDGVVERRAVPTTVAAWLVHRALHLPLPSTRHELIVDLATGYCDIVVTYEK